MFNFAIMYFEGSKQKESLKYEQKNVGRLVLIQLISYSFF